MNNQSHHMRAIAHHEASHAVVAAHYGSTIDHVWIADEWDENGHMGDCRFNHPLNDFICNEDNMTTPENRRLLDKWNYECVVIALAGLPAEQRIKPEATLSRGDREAVESTWKEKASAQRDNLVREATKEAEAIVAANWHAIECVANALMEHRRLTGEKVLRLIASSSG
jgi:hypothetical protein